MPPPQRSSVIGEIRGLYEAMQRFDTLAAHALEIDVTCLRCVNLLRDGPLSPTEIGRRVGLTSGSVTATVDRLERRGMIVRTRSPSDRRSVSVSLAPDAYDRIGAVYSVLGHALGDCLNEAGYGRSPLTAALLAAMIEGVEQANAKLAGTEPQDGTNDNSDPMAVHGKTVAR